jgi:hypothetical protein
MNLYQYCCGNPVATADPTGLFDWEKFSSGIWNAGEAESLFLASMPVAGIGPFGAADAQGMVNAGADFLCGLLTSAEGLTENPLFGKLRDLVRNAQGLANAGLMVAGAFSMARGLGAAAMPKGLFATAPDGPVMRGPSGSQTAGAFHIACRARSMLGGTPSAQAKPARAKRATCCTICKRTRMRRRIFRTSNRTS